MVFYTFPGLFCDCKFFPILTGQFVCFVTVLCLYHYKIIGLNLTTNEHLKGVDREGVFQLNATADDSYLKLVGKVLCGKWFNTLVPNSLIRES